MGDSNSGELQVLVTETGRIDEVDTSDRCVRPGCLGRLRGPIAEWKNPTRNGRYYDRRIWEKVFDTPWVKEAIATKTLFGEADHPDERLESKLSLAAVVLVDYSFDDANQTLYGTFDILDTPSGRILRTLADYGCSLGVSSRGRGSIEKKGNRQVVDPDSYLFGGFDIVALPAVQKARQDFVLENGRIMDIHESIENQIEGCSSIAELRVIQNVLESAQIDDIEEYSTKIDERMYELTNSDDTIVERLTDDLQKSYSEINELKTQLSLANDVDTIDENDAIDKENIKILTGLYEENSKLKQVLIEKDKIINEMEGDGLSRDDDGMTLVARRNESQRTQDQLRRLRSNQTSLEEENTSLKKQVRELTMKATSDKEEYNELVDDYNQACDELKELSHELDETLSKYLRIKSSKSGMELHTMRRLLPENYTAEDIDSLVDSQANLLKRMNKLPISSPTITEHSSPVFKSSNLGLVDPDGSDDLSQAHRMLKSLKG